MFPSLIPIVLGELGPDAVDGFVGVGNGVPVWGYSDNWAVFLVQRDVLVVEGAGAHFEEEPEAGETGGRGSGDGACWGDEEVVENGGEEVDDA